MATLQSHHHLLHCYSSRFPKLHNLRNPSFVKNTSILKRIGDLSSAGYGFESFCCLCTRSSEINIVSEEDESERPPFDINLAVILAGFAFEAYISPPENVAMREVDAADCQTLFLSDSFLREIYDGQLFIKLKKGSKFPALDPWGTSDPYVVMQLESQVVKSNVKWGTREPTWNEELTLNIKLPPNKKNLQVAAWDANLITPHKRMGNAEVDLECLCDGNMHELIVDLEGIGGGGEIQLEIKYKSFDDVIEEEKWWNIPLLKEFLRKSGFDSALRNAVGSDTVQARQFVQYVFGQLKSLKLPDDLDKLQSESSKTSEYPVIDQDMPQELESRSKEPAADTSYQEATSLPGSLHNNVNIDNGQTTAIVSQINEASQSDRDFWRSLSDIVNENVVQKLGLPIPESMKWDKFELLGIVNENIIRKLEIPISESMKWDRFELLDLIGSQSQKIAEKAYVESGLATAQGQDVSNSDAIAGRLTMSSIQSSLTDIKKMTEDVLKQTDSILGGLMVLNATVSEIDSEAKLSEKVNTKDASTNIDDDSEHSDGENLAGPQDGPLLDDEHAAEMKELFSTAESAMEAWAMLATSMGHPSFVKSEFEKLCFLDNEPTDTQVAIWRDSSRKRLVIAFRGTEQVKWKDLMTDLMLVPTGLNPERIGGDFKQEVQVHSGFLNAYDSVRTRILSLIKLAIGCIDDGGEHLSKWHVYVTGHSLGGALATLLALELSSSQLAKHGLISVTMYNFGSPRVGNRKFAEVYNEKVKDSWRVINHRDIIPTVPRLMGYCHVAQPIYLGTKYLESALENVELLEDGYQGDILGESTPDALVNEFGYNVLKTCSNGNTCVGNGVNREECLTTRPPLHSNIKGEKELLDKILSTEINIFRSIRDGTAVMQHMEDFYYITLLEHVRSNYQTVARSKPNKKGDISIT